MWKTSLLPFLGTKSICFPTTRDTNNSSALVMRKEKQRAEASLERKHGDNRRERKHNTEKEKGGGKGLTVLGFTLHFYLVCTICSWRMYALILFSFPILLHSFSAGHKFCYCRGILKGLDEVWAQILLIFPLCPCSLTILRALKTGSGK